MSDHDPNKWARKSLEALLYVTNDRLPRLAQRPQALGNARMALGAIILSEIVKTPLAFEFDVQDVIRNDKHLDSLAARAATVASAFVWLDSSRAPDAASTIDGCWLDSFAQVSRTWRLTDQFTEDLFGRMLAEEIQRPGSVSLQTMRSAARFSWWEIEAFQNLLRFALSNFIIPDLRHRDDGPSEHDRSIVEGLGLISAPCGASRLNWSFKVSAGTSEIIRGQALSIAIENYSAVDIVVEIECQAILTKEAQDLMAIANLFGAPAEFVREIAQQIAVQMQDRHPAEVRDQHIVIYGGSLSESATGFQFFPLEKFLPK